MEKRGAFLLHLHCPMDSVHSMDSVLWYTVTSTAQKVFLSSPCTLSSCSIRVLYGNVCSTNFVLCTHSLSTQKKSPLFYRWQAAMIRLMDKVWTVWAFEIAAKRLTGSVLVVISKRWSNGTDSATVFAWWCDLVGRPLPKMESAKLANGQQRSTAPSA